MRASNDRASVTSSSVGGERRWRPLLAGPAARAAHSAIDDIATALEAGVGWPPKAGHSLFGGTAGIALFFSYLARSGRGEHHQQTADRLLGEATAALSEVPMDASLCAGFTGVAWAVAHLAAEAPGEPDELLEQIDLALGEHLGRSPWRGDYDLVAGLAGHAVYALERLPSAPARECLVRAVDRLEELAEARDAGVTWYTAPELLPPLERELSPTGNYNLGLAHGVPAVIAVLGAASAAGIEKAEALLDGAVAWLLAQELPAAGDESRFASWFVPGERPKRARTAWCYGEPGIAAALLVAARCVGSSEWEQRAVEIARRAARRSPEHSGVIDAGLCHGAAGLGHVFNRMSQTTGDRALEHAARDWLERAVAMRRPDGGVAGFSVPGLNEDGSALRHDDPGLLTGAAGIGLALLAATSELEPAWDRMLLLSVASRAG